MIFLPNSQFKNLQKEGNSTDIFAGCKRVWAAGGNEADTISSGEPSRISQISW